MKLIEYLSSPVFGVVYAQGLAAGLAVVLMCSVLSVLVVVKRLGFVGQGVSHSAFGGIGVAAMLLALGWLPGGSGGGSGADLAQMGVIVLFCIGAAVGMAAVSDRRTVPVDTAIGLFLVGSMALGAVLVQAARGVAESRGRSGVVQSWESILFGSILTVSRTEVLVAWGVAVAVIAAAWLVRRPLLFWALDEDSARAFGVPGGAMKTVLMVVLALAVVTAMKLVGVVLATALLVLPGAAALKLSGRLWPGVVCSCLCGVLGLAGGVVLSAEMDWQPGPCVVLVLIGLFVAAAAVGRGGIKGPTRGVVADAA